MSLKTPFIARASRSLSGPGSLAHSASNSAQRTPMEWRIPESLWIALSSLPAQPPASLSLSFSALSLSHSLRSSS